MSDALKHCIVPIDMTPAEAAVNLEKMADMLEGPAGVGIWQGAVHSETSGNTYSGKMVSVFDQQTMIAPFGMQGDQRAEASAMLFAIALNNAKSLANQFRPPAEIDTSLIEKKDQTDAIYRAKEAVSFGRNPVSAAALGALVDMFKVSEGDVNAMLAYATETMVELSAFRDEVIKQMALAPRKDLVVDLIELTQELGGDPTSLAPLVVVAHKYASEILDHHAPSPGRTVTALTHSAEEINNAGLEAQVRCLVDAYGIAGARHAIKTEGVSPARKVIAL